MVALASPLADPMVIPVALSVDALLLLVEEGVTRLAEVGHTLEIVGRERVLGALLLRKAKR